ncbi:helix-turn-helix domain-containing protein [Rhabdothermincola salaria]|uniref:helix-turn-helix domain-containing protein n=1 Tax=Rhabdothermincola salaria TaxID=2903142 RepID=UPI001E65C8F8|nr:helix-turn-helix domain-containing protein [Rhabdothermincola salaria]MCD9625247.1 helix-turn-helix domain-containing protein [Rhabdothermincola salaria]
MVQKPHENPAEPLMTAGRSTDEIAAVVEARAAGATHLQIAAALGVSRKTVQRLLARPAVKQEVHQRRIDRMEELTIGLVSLADSATSVLAGLLQSDDEGVQHRAAVQAIALALRAHTRLSVDHEVGGRLRELESIHRQAEAVADQMAEYQELIAAMPDEEDHR